MSRVARFKLDTPLYAAGMFSGCTVTIDRSAMLFHVRPKRRRKVFTLPLATVAGIVVHRLTLAEVAAKRAAKRSRRRVVS
jgi:hypothetical protein